MNVLIETVLVVCPGANFTTPVVFWKSAVVAVLPTVLYRMETVVVDGLVSVTRKFAVSPAFTAVPLIFAGTRDTPWSSSWMTTREKDGRVEFVELVKLTSITLSTSGTVFPKIGILNDALVCFLENFSTPFVAT